MFTGIVEEIGNIINIHRGNQSSSVRIAAQKVLKETVIGDSICTNGVCLTVTQRDDRSFVAGIMAETYRRSNFNQLKSGSPVNLERALTLHKPLGGHMVSGHIDGIGTIMTMNREDNAVLINIGTVPSLLRYVIEKGSIAIDGISLTVTEVDDRGFGVSIIPQTGEETILLKKNVGSTVNLETDMIGKYVEKLLGLTPEKNEKQRSGMDASYLAEHGFM